MIRETINHTICIGVDFAHGGLFGPQIFETHLDLTNRWVNGGTEVPTERAEWFTWTQLQHQIEERIAAGTLNTFQAQTLRDDALHWLRENGHTWPC